MRASSAVTIALALAGCATAPPPELVSARRAYAELGPVDPKDAEAARAALMAAYRELDERGKTPYAEDLSYVALRRVAIAAANSRVQQHQRRITWLTNEADALKRRAEERKRLEAELPAPPLVDALDGEAVTSPNEWAAPAQPSDAALLTASSHEPSAVSGAAAPEPATEETSAAPAGAPLSTFSETKTERRGTVVTVSAALLFTPAKVALSGGSQERLEQVAELVKREGGSITVEVHTDNTGTAAENIVLSRQRAKAVRDALISLGVPEKNIEAKGRGATAPIADNGSAEGRAKNRRVEIIIHPGKRPTS